MGGECWRWEEFVYGEDEIILWKNFEDVKNFMDDGFWGLLVCILRFGNRFSKRFLVFILFNLVYFVIEFFIGVFICCIGEYWFIICVN